MLHGVSSFGWPKAQSPGSKPLPGITRDESGSGAEGADCLPALARMSDSFRRYSVPVAPLACVKKWERGHNAAGLVEGAAGWHWLCQCFSQVLALHPLSSQAPWSQSSVSQPSALAHPQHWQSQH